MYRLQKRDTNKANVRQTHLKRLFAGCFKSQRLKKKNNWLKQLNLYNEKIETSNLSISKDKKNKKKRENLRICFGVIKQ